MWTLEFALPNTVSAISALLHVTRRVLVVFERQTVLFMPCFWPQRPLNAQNRHADSIGIYSVFVTLGAEYIGGVGVPGVCKFTISASAETLGIYGVSFACSTETLGICGVFSTSTAQNLMTSMV